MQPVLNDQNGLNSSNEFQIIALGKLPKSSYYDVLSRSASRPSPDEENLGVVPSTPTDQQPVPNSHSTNDNLEVRSCVFSADHSYLAWSCGYGIIKIMKFKEDSTQTSPTSPSSTDSNIKKRSSSSDKEESTITSDESFIQFQMEDAPPKQAKTRRSKIIEIDCGDVVWSLGFGSSKSCLKHISGSRRPKVYRRFNFNEDRLLLAVGLSSGKIRIYDAVSGSFLFGLFDHSDLVRDLKFTKDGSLQLASVSRDETIKLWNMYDDGNMYKTLKGHVGWVNACDWSPTTKMLCSVGGNRQAFIWNTETYKIEHKLKGHLHDVVTCEFSPDGALLATGSYDTKVCLWDPYTGQLIKQFFHLLPPPSFIYAGGHNGAYIRSLAFSANGDHLLSICDDKKIRVWSLCSKTSNPLSEATHNGGISCAYSSNSQTIMIGTRNGQLDFYNIKLVVPRLVDICRKVVNQFNDRKTINELCLPVELKKYLKYEDLRDHLVVIKPSLNITKMNANNASSNNSSNQFQAAVAF